MMERNKRIRFSFIDIKRSMHTFYVNSQCSILVLNLQRNVQPCLVKHNVRPNSHFRGHCSTSTGYITPIYEWKVIIKYIIAEPALARQTIYLRGR
jgi:hypothetical protein